MGLTRAVSTTQNANSLKNLCRTTGFKSKPMRLRRKQINQQRTEGSEDGKTQVVVEVQSDCFGCKRPIKSDKFILKACDRFWHESCLRCHRCQAQLGDLGSTFFCKSDMYLCRRDYLDMFGDTSVCSICEKLIRAHEMVMRAKKNVYHLDCFACQLCNLRFCVGDRFYLCENKIVCQYDYEEHILPIEKSLIEVASDTNEIGGIISSSPSSLTGGFLDLSSGSPNYTETNAPQLQPLETASSMDGATLISRVSGEEPGEPTPIDSSLPDHNECEVKIDTEPVQEAKGD